MNALLMTRCVVTLAGLLLAAGAALGEDSQPSRQPVVAATAQVSAAQPAGEKAPSAAYIIEQNQDSQVSKREVPGGWREVNVKGVVYWCQNNKAMGSRVKREARCVTPQQYDLMMEESQRTIDDGRRNSLPPKGG